MAGEDDKSKKNENTPEGKSENAAVQLKLPLFWSECPEVWFIQVEIQFKLRQITRDRTKFEHVLAGLPQEIILKVLDVIRQPPEDNPYEVLKTTLIQRLSLSEEKKIDKLLSNIEIGDRRPSEFFRSLENLASPESFSRELLKKLWLRRLPQTINVALLGVEGNELSEILVLADKIWETIQPQNISAMATSTNANYVNPNILQTITNSIDEFRIQLNELQNNFRHRSRSRQSSGSRVSFHRSNSRSQVRPKFEHCWYHRRFRKRATKCREPCSFKENDTPKN